MESKATRFATHAGLFVLSCLVVSAPAGDAAAQVAGSTTLGVAVAEVDAVAYGWSAKKQVLGHTVINENKEKVGTIDDIIIAPDKLVSYAIVGVGGFVGVGKHDIAIPASQFKEEGGKFVLAGATKAAIKALPKFEYAKKVKKQQ